MKNYITTMYHTSHVKKFLYLFFTTTYVYMKKDMDFQFLEII